MSLLDQYARCRWKSDLNAALPAELMKELDSFLEAERKIWQVYPPEQHIFAALDYTPLENTRVVLIGQDPYHGPGQAHGLAFSVPVGVALPPSLKNMLKELNTDIGPPQAVAGNLSTWANQGVLLLNTVLTVREAQPGSHASNGWEVFTDTVIKTVDARSEHVVFLLLGNHAAKKLSLIDRTRHTVVQAAHPSPLSASRGFFGSRVFSRVNAALAAHQQATIEW